MRDIISIRNLSKVYEINHEKTKYKSFRDEMVNIVRHPLSVFSEKSEKFYALKNISFSVKEGETLGIIGPNGAGKSTLLKILSRIISPTSGEVRLNGRVSSLLEVGTGFHPELTGRENIFLSGAILGMTQKEIKRKFDEIVDFSGIEKFLDTSVKHFSSGMYTRLAFSVAAHLEPEILIVDEVLAVGDAEFQKKCLGKMQQVGKEGRTVIFVSHNMGAVSHLCSSAILLEKGCIYEKGNTREVINKYLKGISTENETDLVKSHLRKTEKLDSIFYFSKIRVVTNNRNVSEIMEGKHFVIEVLGDAKETLEDFYIGLTIHNSSGTSIYTSQITSREAKLKGKKGKILFTLSFDKNVFSPGVYTIGLGARGTRVLDWIPEAISFNISPNTKSDQLQGIYDGLIIYPRNWKIEIK